MSYFRTRAGINKTYLNPNLMLRPDSAGNSLQIEDNWHHLMANSLQTKLLILSKDELLISYYFKVSERKGSQVSLSNEKVLLIQNLLNKSEAIWRLAVILQSFFKIDILISKCNKLWRTLTHLSRFLLLFYNN